MPFTIQAKTFAHMVEVFKTNVRRPTQAKQLIALLLQHFPNSKINFDLTDCDKILRVEGTDFCAIKIMDILTEYGFVCSILD